MRIIVFLTLLTACQLSADLVSTNSRAASEAWVSRRFASTQDLAAVTGQLGPRIAALESGTNGWNAAYAWGNHAVAGYLLGSAWNTWLSTNTYVKTELDQTALAALAAFASTNNLTRWRLSSTNWLEYAGNGVITNFILTPVMTGPWWHFEGADFIESDIPHPVNVVVTDRWSILYDGNGYEFNLVGSEWWGYLAVFDDQNGPVLLTNRVSFAETNLVYSLVPSSAVSTNFVVYNLTTGNVWQAVGEAKTAADDAQLAADQAATLINYHTTLDAAPHAGKFVTPLQLTNNTSHVMAQWYAADGSLTQQIVRVGAEIWTNRWPVGTAGAITNGWSGDTVKINNLKISQWPGGLETRAFIDCSDYYGFAYQGTLVFYMSPRGASFPQNKMATFGNNENAVIYYNGTDLIIDSARVGGGRTRFKRDTINEGTNTAAVIVSQGPVFFGPVINGKQMFLDGDATNAWIVNVNSVTNAL